MKNLLSKITFSLITLALFISVPGYAQLIQWNGPMNTTSPIYRAGSVGIGISRDPSEMLEVGGRVELGNTLTPPASTGILRWTGTDFQGYNGSDWESMISKWELSGNNIVNNNTGHVQLGLTNNLGIGRAPNSKLEIYSVDPRRSWSALQIRILAL